MAEAMYHELADWWPLVSAPDEYAEEAGFYRRLLDEAGPAERVLELGSGGGSNACHLKAHYALTLVDASEGMLAVSRALNPGCEHVLGDMRDLRLGRVFDAVFIHDAIDYMTTRADLRAALRTARIHCREGGAVLLAPDHMAETFEEEVSHGGHDGDGRSLRFLEWTHDPDPGDETFRADYAFMLRDRDGSVRVVHDSHVCGLFSEAVWLDSCRSEGLEPEVRQVFHSDVGEARVILCRAV